MPSRPAAARLSRDLVFLEVPAASTGPSRLSRSGSRLPWQWRHGGPGRCYALHSISLRGRPCGPCRSVGRRRCFWLAMTGSRPRLGHVPIPPRFGEGSSGAQRAVHAPSGSFLSNFRASLGEDFYMCKLQEPGDADAEVAQVGTASSLKSSFLFGWGDSFQPHFTEADLECYTTRKSGSLVHSMPTTTWNGLGS